MKNIGIFVFVLTFAIGITIAEPVCNIACYLIYGPVCGIDNTGKKETYGNRCALDSDACVHKERGISYVADGECQ